MTTALGLQVEGNVDKSRSKGTVQRPAGELAELLSVLSDYPEVSVRWRQYTPYFNDGEPCEFHTSEPGANFDPADRDDLYGDGIGEYGDGFITSFDVRWATREKDQHTNDDLKIQEYARTDAWKAVRPLLEAVESGAFDDALYEAFGDHAIVTVRGSNAEVETYEHD